MLDGGFGSRIVRLDGEAVIAVAGELDMATAPQLWFTKQALAQTGRLVLDLADMTFVESSGLGILVRAHGQLPRTANC